MTRAAVAWLNYPGDRTAVVGQRVGPTYDGREYLWAVEAEYDSAADITRVGFTYVPPPDQGGAQP